MEPLAYNPHGGSGVDFARKVLAALDANGTQAALGIIDQAEKDAKAKAATTKSS